MSGSNVPVRASPLLAADNDAIYGGLLGLSKDEIARLQAGGAI
jgi:hypothetical protein